MEKRLSHFPFKEVSRVRIPVALPILRSDAAVANGVHIPAVVGSNPTSVTNCLCDEMVDVLGLDPSVERRASSSLATGTNEA